MFIICFKKEVFIIAISFFDSKAVMPDENMVADVLADSSPLWNELKNYVQDNYPNVSGEWKHYGKASGWVYKLLSKKRNLLFFTPKSGGFRLRFSFGENAAACIEVSDLPDIIKEAIRTATPYAEGRSIDLDMDSGETKIMAYLQDRRLVDIGAIHGQQLELVKTLLKIKFM